MSANDAVTPMRSAQRDARFLRDVPELAAAEVLPELVAAELVHEVDVVEAVAVDVRDGDAVSVVVVHRLVDSARIVDDVVHERDAALLHAVGELEMVEDIELVDRLALRLRARRERVDTNVGVRRLNLQRLGGERRAEDERRKYVLHAAERHRTPVTSLSFTLADPELVTHTDRLR